MSTLALGTENEKQKGHLSLEFFDVAYAIYETTRAEDDYRAFSYLHRFYESLPEPVHVCGRILGVYRGPKLKQGSHRARGVRIVSREPHYRGIGRIRRHVLQRFGFLPSHHWFSNIDANLYSAIRWIATWNKQNSKAVVFAEDLDRGLKIIELIFLFAKQIPEGLILVLLRPTEIDSAKLNKLRNWGVTILLDAAEATPIQQVLAHNLPLYEFNSLIEMPLLPQRYPVINWHETLASAHLKIRNPEKVLFIRPDWMKCGSATTFAKLTHLFQERGAILIDVALQPYNLFCDRDTINAKLDEVETDLSTSLHFNLRRSFLPAALLKTAFRLLKQRPRTVAGFLPVFYQQCTIPRVVKKLIQSARIDYLYVNHYFSLPIAKEICPSQPLYLDTHDIQSLNFVSHDYHLKIRRRAFPFTACLQEELAVIDQADRVTMVSREEIDLIQRYRPEHDFFYYIPLPDAKRVALNTSTSRERKRSLAALIVASRNPANERSLRWFLNSIWIRIVDLPLQLTIVGNIDVSFKGQDYDNVEFTGMVDDLQSMYMRSDLIILPITNGGGIAIKTLEALQSGLPISCTRHAMRGLPSDVQQALPGSLTDNDFIEDLIHLGTDSKALSLRKEQVELAHQRLIDMNFDAQMNRELDWICSLARGR
jgi:glycosyltransferase involved in cell wall biosynthesis